MQKARYKHRFAKLLISFQALLSKAHDNCTDSDIVKATYAILFFGVPSQGMNIESIIPMVGDQPNRALVESLSKVSETLITQQAAFVQVFPLNGSELICFYETRQSPTAERKVSNLIVPVPTQSTKKAWVAPTHFAYDLTNKT